MKTPIIHIITTSARPHLLHGLLSSIYSAVPSAVDVRLHVLFKTLQKDPGGLQAINETLSNIPKDDQNWVVIYCDDNHVHAHFFRRIQEIIEANHEAKAIVVEQERHDNPNGVVEATPEWIKPGCVDGSQCLVRGDLIGDLLIPNSPTSDGEFIQALYKKDPTSFCFISEVLAYYEAAYWFQGGGEKGDRYYWHENVIKMDTLLKNIAAKVEQGKVQLVVANAP